MAKKKKTKQKIGKKKSATRAASRSAGKGRPGARRKVTAKAARKSARKSGRKAARKAARKAGRPAARTRKGGPARKRQTASRASKTGAGRKRATKSAAAKRATAKPTPTKSSRRNSGGAGKPDVTPRLVAPAARPPAVASRRPARGGSAPRAGRPSPRAATRTKPAVPGVVVTGRQGPRFHEILSMPALAFLADLHRRFDSRRKELLRAREARQKQFDAGTLPDFLPETASVRDGNWTVAPIPKDLMDRRVEITGPVDRRMVINALNSGARVFMADFEDANAPTWANNIEGQLNLKDRWQGKIDFHDPGRGKTYTLGPDPAVLIVRPRGWHLPEAHLTVDGEPISGALFDFGLYVFHNARTILAKGSQPYFYLPKLESHLEARLWNDVFVFAQEKLGLALRTIKATVLIETLPAAFEMEEILYELRDHIVGLNAGRWDYIFSFIKVLANNPDYVLPDRSQVVMGKAFLGSYAALLVKTCHKRGAFAMGGMAAQIPVKGDAAANEKAFAKVQADKEREVREGHDGTWVAHPDLVPVAKAVFDRLMPQPNQLDVGRGEVKVGRDDLLTVHEGTRTEAGFRENIRVGVQYIEAWLGGRGAVPIYNLMEDAATAEISRAQIWQWLRYGATLDDGTKVTPEFFERALAEEMERVRQEVGARRYAAGHFPAAIKLFRDLALAADFPPFLTLPAYALIN